MHRFVSLGAKRGNIVLWTASFLAVTRSEQKAPPHPASMRLATRWKLGWGGLFL